MGFAELVTFVNMIAVPTQIPQTRSIFIVPGMLAGSAYQHAGAFAGHLALPLATGLVVLAALVWGARRLRRSGVPAGH